MYRPRSCALAAAFVAALALAAPAAADHGHGSCQPAAEEFIVPLAQSGDAGPYVVAKAQAGTLNENLAAAKAVRCEPRP